MSNSTNDTAFDIQALVPQTLGIALAVGTTAALNGALSKQGFANLAPYLMAVLVAGFFTPGIVIFVNRKAPAAGKSPVFKFGLGLVTGLLCAAMTNVMLT